MKRLIKKIIFFILNPLFHKNRYIYINPTFLGELINLMYLSTVKRDFKIIIDPFELFKRNKLVNIKIFQIAYYLIMKKKINFFFNFLHYLYYKSNLYTENINNITITGYRHRDNKAYKNLSKKNDSYFDIHESKSNDDYINQIVKKKYLLFSCRDSAYKKKISNLESSYHSYRNENISNFELALTPFLKKNFQLVRFGSKAEKRCSDKKIFDYTFSKFRNEKNDLLLMKNCDIYIGTGSGPDILAMNFQKPIVYTNWIHPPNLFTFQNNVVVIFKKVFDKKNKKYIPYKKLIDLNFKFKNEETPVGIFDKTNQYNKFNLELIENSPDEIFNAVSEMINFRCGKFNFDKEVQNSFKVPFTEKTKNLFSSSFFISEYFIKKNINLFN